MFSQRLMFTDKVSVLSLEQEERSNWAQAGLTSHLTQPVLEATVKFVSGAQRPE